MLSNARGFSNGWCKPGEFASSFSWSNLVWQELKYKSTRKLSWFPMIGQHQRAGGKHRCCWALRRQQGRVKQASGAPYLHVGAAWQIRAGRGRGLSSWLQREEKALSCCCKLFGCACRRRAGGTGAWSGKLLCWQRLMGATCRGSLMAGCPLWTAGSQPRSKRLCWRRKSRCWGGSPSSLALLLEPASSSRPKGSWRTQAVWACPWLSGQCVASSHSLVSLSKVSNWSRGAAGGLFLFFVWFCHWISRHSVELEDQ